MSEQNEISFFARTDFRNQSRIFGIKTDDRRRHMYIIGKTGMGKTNLLENLAIQDIKHGKGVAFLDPHGDTAEKLIKAIPTNRINDVIYFNPADQDFPIAFNVMENINPEYKHLVASGLVGVFKKLWADSWGPRLEYILRNAILALLEYPGSTLLGVTRILVDKEYREKVVANITDPVVRAFWVDEFSKWNDRVLQEVISPIQNKVGQFLSTTLIRNIVGQTKSSFDVREAMDSGKILIMNLSKGRVGEDASALIGAMMITKIQLAAMERVDMLEEERKDFYLYVDEFQNFATESFANILSEARKYRLNLVLANQYIAQLDEKVSDAIFGNAGTIISFRVGAADAESLEKEFEPVFTMNDIVNLQKYNIYLKLMIDGIAGDAFSATVLPPISIEDTLVNEEKVIRNSRERYTGSKQEVEDKINRWSGMLTAGERAELAQKKAAPLLKTYTPTALPRVTAAPPVAVSPAKPLPLAANKPAAPILKHIAPIRPHRREELSSVDPVKIEEPLPSSLSFPSPEPAAPPSPSVIAQAPLSEEGNSVLPGPLDHFLDASAAMQTSPLKDVSKEESSVAEHPLVVPSPEPPPSHEPEEKPSYPALCATCNMEIRVPFKPDASRPTFCKECFKSHQRKLAKEREKRQSLADMAEPAVVRPRVSSPPPAPKRSLSARVYEPTRAPLSLAQSTLIAPRKFKSLQKRSAPDLGAVRDILEHTKHSS